MILKCAEVGVPHPEGIFAAVCVDVIELGQEQVEYHGVIKTVEKLRLVFETDDGEPRWLARKVTASIHPKSRMGELIGKWRGRPILPGETFDTKNLIGASATLVVSHQQKADGTGVFAGIDAVSRPTRKVTPSGRYNPEEAREKIRQYKAQEQTERAAGVPPVRLVAPAAGPGPALAVDDEDDVPF